MADERSGEQGGSAYGRKGRAGWERDKPGKRHKRGLEEKLRKYEVRAEGYEFVPALMHVLERYVAGVPRESQTDLDRRLARRWTRSRTRAR